MSRELSHIFWFCGMLAQDVCLSVDVNDLLLHGHYHITGIIFVVIGIIVGHLQAGWY